MVYSREARAACLAILVSFASSLSPLSSPGHAQTETGSLQPVERLLWSVSPDVRVAPVFSYDADPTTIRSMPTYVRLQSLELPGATSDVRLESAAVLLRDAGVIGFQRLSEGLTIYPPEWEHTYVVRFRASLRAEEARQLCASLESTLPGSRAEVDALYPHPHRCDRRVGTRLCPFPSSICCRASTARESPRERGGSRTTRCSSPVRSGGCTTMARARSNAVAGLDLRAPEAWLTTTGSTSITLGVVDTGVDPESPRARRDDAGRNTALSRNRRVVRRIRGAVRQRRTRDDGHGRAGRAQQQRADTRRRRGRHRGRQRWRLFGCATRRHQGDPRQCDPPRRPRISRAPSRGRAHSAPMR